MVWKGFGDGFGWIWDRFGAVLGAFGEGSGRIFAKGYARFREGFLIFGRWLVLGPPKQNILRRAHFWAQNLAPVSGSGFWKFWS